MTPDERAYAIHRAEPTACAILANLPAACSLPYALGPRTSERSGTMVCVGAGPSLSETGPELARLQRAGALILTVNTALPAVSRYVVPDVVLVREVVDVSSHLAHPVRLRVLDLAASSKVWAAAQAMGPCAWFIAGADHLFELAHALGVRPLFGGPAALTSLVALCEEWGAAEIVLVGCDLAIADDGKSYADGSAFSGQRADIGPDGVAVNSGEGFARKQAQHAAGGVEAYPTREATALVERWGGGGKLRTTTQWLPQLEWLGTFAARHGGITCVDATGAGARKAGWIELRSAGVPRHSRYVLLSTPAPSMAEAMLARARAHLLAEAAMLATVCANVMHDDGNPVAVPGLLAGSDFTETLCARELVAADEATVRTSERIRLVYEEAWPRACDVVADGVRL